MIMISKVVSFLLLIIVVTGCSQSNNKKQPSEKRITIGILAMDIPSTFEFIRAPGVDSYSAEVIIGKKDTFHLEYGGPKIIYNLFLLPPKAIPLKEKEGMLKNLGKLPPSDEVVFSVSPEDDNIQNVFDKNYYMYDTINGLIEKIIQPKRMNSGMTGIYIRNLKDGNSFSMYAENLDSTAHLIGLKIFHSIKYK